MAESSQSMTWGIALGESSSRISGNDELVLWENFEQNHQQTSANGREPNDAVRSSHLSEAKDSRSSQKCKQKDYRRSESCQELEEQASRQELFDVFPSVRLSDVCPSGSVERSFWSHSSRERKSWKTSAAGAAFVLHPLAVSSSPPAPQPSASGRVFSKSSRQVPLGIAPGGTAAASHHRRLYSPLV